MPQFGTPQRGEKTKALDLMIAIGTGSKKHGMEEGGNYKEPMDSKADMGEDKTEGETEDSMCKCGEPMVCKGCDMPESECSCD